MPSARPPSGSALHAWDAHPAPEELAALDAACFAQPWDTETYRSALANPHIRCWIVREGTPPHPIGWLLVQTVAAEAEILRLGVLPAFQRHGKGREILGQVLELLGEQRAERVFLEVRASNAPALRLYRSTGFQEIGKRRGYYQEPSEDAVVMALQLGNAD